MITEHTIAVVIGTIGRYTHLAIQIESNLYAASRNGV